MHARLLSSLASPVVAAALGLASTIVCGAAELVAAPSRLTPLSEHLLVYGGPIQTGVVRDGDRALLIDCGDGSVAAALKSAGIAKVDRLLFTHHHRDQACGAREFPGAKVAVPAAERACFDQVGAYWQDPKSRWHLYNQHPHHLMLAEPLRVDEVLDENREITWGNARLRVLTTPGHTDGSISLVVETDGQRVVFCGDALAGEGQVWDLHSLQKGTVTTDYHGFLGARPQLKQSLAKIRAVGANKLVPSHGPILERPAEAIDLLSKRLDACYDQYVAISALRHYFPKMFVEYQGRPRQMPIRPGKPVPDCLRHVGTSWILVSKDRAALVMDCGSPAVIAALRRMHQKGEIRAVEALWVTHYHDDHVDAIPEFQKTFDCPCITDDSVAQVIANPLAWRLPCISPSKARVDRRTRDGESWTWHEYRLTAYHLPGQTLYHSGLLAEGNGLRMLFVGDSFTMAGIDDYCMHNRNWLGEGLGFDRCIALIDRLRPSHLFNCHVNEAFDFTHEECSVMRENLARRQRQFGELTPWDHVNYAMDEPWVRCDPYEQRASKRRVELELVITNHSSEARAAACRPVLPRVWPAAPAKPGSDDGWVRRTIPSKTDGRLPLVLDVPPRIAPGRYVIPVDLRYGDRLLPQFTEAIVVIE